jgi:hypothetical protein
MIFEKMVVGKIDKFRDIGTASPDKAVGGRRNRREVGLEKRVKAQIQKESSMVRAIQVIE